MRPGGLRRSASVALHARNPRAALAQGGLLVLSRQSAPPCITVRVFVCQEGTEHFSLPDLKHPEQAGLTVLSSLCMQEKYGEALDQAAPSAPQRAVYFANRAACALKLRQVRRDAAQFPVLSGVPGGHA